MGLITRVGLISDTHGLLRPDVFRALEGVDVILHAGDVGGNDILDELGAIAPVRAVSGNTDAPGNPRLTDALDLQIGTVRIHVSHGHEVGAPNAQRLLARYDADVIVYGHSHRQSIVRVASQLVINPGAAGARRFDLRPSVAVLSIVEGTTATAELVELLADD